jgi:hypothetical protein
MRFEGRFKSGDARLVIEHPVDFGYFLDGIGYRLPDRLRFRRDDDRFRLRGRDNDDGCTV